MWLVDFSAGKTQLVLFDHSNTGAIDVKMDGSVGSLIHSMKFLSPEVALYLCISTIRPCRNTVVMSWLVLLIATWNCWISYKNGYAGLLVLYLLPLLNPWLTARM